MAAWHASIDRSINLKSTPTRLINVDVVDAQTETQCRFGKAISLQSRLKGRCWHYLSSSAARNADNVQRAQTSITHVAKAVCRIHPSASVDR